MERGAWWATVHGVTKSQTQLSDFTVGFGTAGKNLWASLSMKVSKTAVQTSWHDHTVKRCPIKPVTTWRVGGLLVQIWIRGGRLAYMDPFSELRETGRGMKTALD